MSSSIGLWFHTLRYLRPVQFLNWGTRRLPKRVSATLPARRASTGIWVEPVQFRPEPMIRESRLRDYTLNYHYRPDSETIERWIVGNPPALGAGWEPYPLSLRTVNWIKWALDGNDPPEAMSRSLGEQLSRLATTVEYEILANHLFTNAKALVFGGAFFEQNEWLDRGLGILREEVPEQLCDDGGHFERSPMYQCLIAEDLLDLVNLGNAYPGLLPDWRGPAARTLGWLREMMHPDGRIPFFNDATFGAVPEPAAILDYAARLGVAPAETGLSDSGYVRLENENTVVFFDAGPVGPNYQPGHAHCDTLSFELSHRGKRILVNSGISTYERNAERQQQRSTAAHNTVVVDGEEQSEIWAAFRVARRAYPINVEAGDTWAEAAHTGYRRLKSPVVHRRRLDLQPDRLLVTDTLEGAGTHRADVHFHQHPDASASIQLDPKLVRREENTAWHPGFDRAVPNRTISGHWKGPCPASFVTTVHLP